VSTPFHRSEALLERALKVIPLGSQTFSKSLTQFPYGVSPYFIQRGEGCWVWDVDGNRMLDMIGSLAAVTLGHGDPDVNIAVRRQLEEGVLFSLPHPIETEVAEAIVRMVPCAEMVRFGKNGSDATAGAIRIARAATGRDLVAVCGYHGWQDWYIGATARHRGVPQATRALTHTFGFNDIASLERLLQADPGGYAAVMLEPMNVIHPEPGFLEAVRDLAHAHGALFIFDETITGFRFARGGAQEWFGVTPDLATFGKGLANGFPLSAVAGRADLMKLMEEIFFSFTFGGETLSLAAARATLDKLEREPVLETIHRQGSRIMAHVDGLIDHLVARDIVGISGHPSWSFLVFSDTAGTDVWTLKTLYMQEMLARGVLTFGTHNVGYRHDDEALQVLFAAYDEVLPMLVEAVRQRRVETLLRCKPLVPLFKVR